MSKTHCGFGNPEWAGAVNAALDKLPPSVPVFRACGVAGFYLALLVSFGCCLATGRSVAVLAAAAAVCAVSFYAYAHLRRLLIGYESLVLLEHVWFALGCSAAMLAALRQPVLPMLDVVAIGLCVFLVAGRAGCLLTGCCHGRPSPLGIAYRANGAFSGVRLLPVPALELAALIAIGVTGAAALHFAAPGRVLAWFVLAYSAVRWGTEGLRGDRRPHLFGISQARWMSLAASIITVGWLDPGRLWLVWALAASAVAGIAAAWVRNPERRLLAPAHLREIQDIAVGAPNEVPLVRNTSRGVTVAFSAAGQRWRDAAHVALALPPGAEDVRLLCEVSARAFPALLAGSAAFTLNGVLHFAVPSAAREETAKADELYAAAVRHVLGHAAPTESEPARTGASWFFSGPHAAAKVGQP